MTVYYNEFDKKAAAWLQELIKQGHIAPGIVDERSIEDVRPNDLIGFTQCHFFAGIGGWSLALRRAGWSDDRPIWTGSCPCQPFSAAGKGAAFDDERHLWPHFQWLIQERKPAAIAGEQVASKDADAWLDLVQTDLEGMDYAFGAIAFPSAGVGAPHIRDRTYWVAHAEGDRYERPGQLNEQTGRHGIAYGGTASGLADMQGERLSGEPIREGGRRSSVGITDNSSTSRLEHADLPIQHERASVGKQSVCGVDNVEIPSRSAGPTNGLWADADWLRCRDGYFRPVEPSTFPLANGVSGRMGLLRGYGNAINVEAAKIFIEAVMECIE